MSRKASGGEGSGAGMQRSSDNRQPRDEPPPFRGGAGDATRLPAPAQCVKEVPRARGKRLLRFFSVAWLNLEYNQGLLKQTVWTDRAECPFCSVEAKTARRHGRSSAGRRRVTFQERSHPVLLRDVNYESDLQTPVQRVNRPSSK